MLISKSCNFWLMFYLLKETSVAYRRTWRANAYHPKDAVEVICLV